MSAIVKYFVKTLISKHIFKKKPHTYVPVHIFSSVQKRSVLYSHAFGDLGFDF